MNEHTCSLLIALGVIAYLTLGIIFYIFPKWMPESVPGEDSLLGFVLLAILWPLVVAYYGIKQGFRS